MGIHLKSYSIPITRRLEIVLLISGLSGIFLTRISCFLPWGLAGHGKNGEVLIVITGLYGASPSSIIVVMFMFPLLVATHCYVYSLLIQRNSKETSLILTAGGTCMIFLASISCAYCLYTLDIRTYTTLIGCSFVILAGLLSHWRTKLMPIDLTLPSRGMAFKTYVFKKILISTVSIIGISLVLFCLWSLFPPGLRDSYLVLPSVPAFFVIIHSSTLVVFQH